MENVVEPPQPSISLSKFLEDYIEKLNSSNPVPFYFDANPPVTEDVEKSCSIQLLSAQDENAINIFEPGGELQRSKITGPLMDQHVPETYSAVVEQKLKSRRNPFTRTRYSHRLIPEPTANGELGVFGEFEIQITVRFYRPPRAAHRGYKLERPVFAEEFICLGSNYLTELRDKIPCICKDRRFVDISDDPEAALPVIQTNPGYFFINNTFYNDTRNPKNCNYAQTVLKWAQSAQGIESKYFKTESMETTRFRDLTVSLGTPLQYLHHGNCEHLFVFSQVEVLRPNSTYPNRSSYPFLRAINSFNRRSCYMCGTRGYHFIVEQSRRQLHDPSYLCRSCFYSFHYVDGRKVGHFKAYRIFDHTERSEEDSAAQQDKLDINSGGNSSSDECNEMD